MEGEISTMAKQDYFDEARYGLRVGHLVSLLERLMRNRISHELAGLDITLQQYVILLLLNTRGPISNAEVARASFIAPQSANKVVKALTERQFIEARTNPAHKRVQLLSLTATGENMLAQADKLVMKVERQLLEHYSETDQKLMQQLLQVGVRALST